MSTVGKPREELLKMARETSTSPGVYLMKDADDVLLYVGKAKNLRNRVSSYFQDRVHVSPRIEMLVGRVDHFDVILTETESEALILENTLIKKHKPKFNVSLKDDKTYPYIRIQVNDAFPRLEWTRKVRRDGARYFGPFPSAWAAKQVMMLINETYQLRDCSDNTFAHRSRPCILYQMGRCTAPCVGKIDRSQYHEQIQEICDVLEGRSDSLKNEIESKMMEAAESMEYEIAAHYRDQLQNLGVVTETQAVVEAGVERDRDVVGVARQGTIAHGVLLQIRGGKLVAVRHYHLQNTDTDVPESVLLYDFLSQHYVASADKTPKRRRKPTGRKAMAMLMAGVNPDSAAPEVPGAESNGKRAPERQTESGGSNGPVMSPEDPAAPAREIADDPAAPGPGVGFNDPAAPPPEARVDASSDNASMVRAPDAEEGLSAPTEVLVKEAPADPELLERVTGITIRVPETDAERQLVNVAEANAKHALASAAKKAQGHGLKALEEVQKKLHLEGMPQRIECYDISNIHGQDAVASRVVFIDGAPDKNLYRRYKIKTVEGSNDFAMMKEVLGRRFLNTDEDLPDLVVVDGGKGQLSQATAILDELNVQGVAVVGLAKARTESDFQSSEVKASDERVFVPGRKNPVPLQPHTSAFKLLTHVRDEAHRFAVSYHRLLRSKRTFGGGKSS